ncbi:hypothetical protein [Gemmata sp.]|uniref:hypothetical protein n=1 Tax=Gemmata sp. TaxID=1914242 RepID=UPI003F6F1F97
MTLSRRFDALEQQIPRVKPGRPVPDHPVAFARGLLAGAFSPEDLDPCHPHHTGWLTTVYAFLTTLTPEHQASEAEAGIATGATCLDAEGLAALDAFMRRG